MIFNNTSAAGGVPEGAAPIKRRRLALNIFALGLLPSLGACAKGKSSMSGSIVLNVVLYSYLDRPISFINLNHTDLGVASAYGTTSVVGGVEIPFGEQKLSWMLDGPEGMARNGEVVTARNKVIISRAGIPDGTRYLGISVYPDETIDIVYEASIPDKSARGKKILEQRRAKNG